MIIGPMTEECIETVINNISDASLNEFAVLGYSPWDVEGMFKRWVEKPFTGVFCDNQENPLAVIALLPEGDMKWRTHFIFAQDAFPVIGKELTRFLTKFSSDFVEKSGGAIEVISAADKRRWFEVMGFEEIGEDSGLTRYIKRR